ncbi:DUF5990 family protein [Streptomyces sp. NBC_01387]|uniref:DUF5990 family protein n=1 Tax=unclassified Streptomyces TaxID=2593676 RepID=UPI0020250D1B|nr:MULTISPECIES: DUF5990 family protein [unclassified Streptomyces]MCX4552789.1 DUF5990 family protein [Streptomyces sp. NBC_01500]WSC24124.1 DUF5990 family protein [Streptomyces sp. NBC_01766]WSV58010.1 DUF5990 family protein [Streptomyces sp. NBC_01014]
MKICIEATALPGRTSAAFADAVDIQVGVQAKDRPQDVVELHAGDSPSASWTLDCTTTVTPDSITLAGPYIQHRFGGRFIYLSWTTTDGTGTATMFRRAKLMLDAVPTEVLDAAVLAGRLTAELRLTDAAGAPLCGSVRPPLIIWSAGPNTP